MNLSTEVIEKADKKKILRVAGEVDAYTAPELKANLNPLTEEEGVEVIVDLTDVSYIDSTGLGIFIGALKSAENHGATLRLTGLNERVKRLFTITGLDEVITIDDENTEEAK
ncbi:anti-sigma factor antagonist [Marinococcus halophilus]|uniref:Anti-sigma factor antagonist n=1 Tax=Marinococcus halophilus TaxID=1371 RepID=A0A510Y2C7_MARHA|nr:STAS domain-containing protein [Marinococcus halophilus]OZT81533.1 anti-sigma factor antagonist [Marinococcus halophilus]GEK57475.1 anti-sigma-B factor antagonist [Marinococcus halophilus]